MKTRLAIIAFLITGILGLAFSPARQDVPPRPVITIDAGGQTAREDISSYCWPIAQGNNKCDFAVSSVPQNPLTVDPGQAVTIIIDNSPGDPTSLGIRVMNANGEQIFNPAPAPQVIFEEELPAGENTLEITAQYTGIAGTEGYVTYVFSLIVLPPPVTPTSTSTATPTEIPATATEIPPTVTPTEIPSSTPAPSLTPIPPTEELVLPEETEEVSGDETEAPAATEEAAVPTEESGQMMGAATEESAVTEEAAAPTEAVVETEAPTEEVVPTEAVTEEPAVTEEAAAASATPVIDASPGGLPPQQEPPQVAERPTFTTVPLVIPGQEESAVVNPTSTTVALPTATLIPPSSTPVPSEQPASAGPAPTEPPTVQLTFAGRSYDPAANIFCQTGANNQRSCDEVREPSPQPIAVLAGSAVQIRLDGSRPMSVDIALVDSLTSTVSQTESRPGDTLILLDVDVDPGRYVLRVRFNWDGADSEYFFQLQVN